ncbi:uncharacterized protein IWZ02DRAFT_464368 [Phyllosticta citriasiana]|uniref:uncharacterized protein n=1 Tax=Phyllosticta citriasiana TaxID=595635 RepID=UPI0030FD9B0A
MAFSNPSYPRSSPSPQFFPSSLSHSSPSFLSQLLHSGRPWHLLSALQPARLFCFSPFFFLLFSSSSLLLSFRPAKLLTCKSLSITAQSQSLSGTATAAVSDFAPSAGPDGALSSLSSHLVARLLAVVGLANLWVVGCGLLAFSCWHRTAATVSCGITIVRRQRCRVHIHVCTCALRWRLLVVLSRRWRVADGSHCAGLWASGGLLACFSLFLLVARPSTLLPFSLSFAICVVLFGGRVSLVTHFSSPFVLIPCPSSLPSCSLSQLGLAVCLDVGVFLSFPVPLCLWFCCVFFVSLFARLELFIHGLEPAPGYRRCVLASFPFSSALSSRGVCGMLPFPPFARACPVRLVALWRFSVSSFSFVVSSFRVPSAARAAFVSFCFTAE